MHLIIVLLSIIHGFKDVSCMNVWTDVWKMFEKSSRVSHYVPVIYAKSWHAVWHICRVCGLVGFMKESYQWKFFRHQMILVLNSVVSFPLKIMCVFVGVCARDHICVALVNRKTTKRWIFLMLTDPVSSRCMKLTVQLLVIYLINHTCMCSKRNAWK
jgi:hypothetical protein